MERERGPARPARAGPHPPGQRDHRPAATSLLRRCAASDLLELHRLATTIETWWPEILAFLHTGITNAGSEGANRVIKTVARDAYGFRNPENQRLRTRTATTRRHRGHLNPAQLRRAQMPPADEGLHRGDVTGLSGLPQAVEQRLVLLAPFDEGAIKVVAQHPLGCLDPLDFGLPVRPEHLSLGALDLVDLDHLAARCDQLPQRAQRVRRADPPCD
nr:transposase [Micromonospora craniellae]